MSAADTDTRILLPDAETMAAISRGEIPDWPPKPSRPYVGRHFHIEDRETAVISAEHIAAARGPVVSQPVPVPNPPPSDQSMRKLARLLGNLRKPRWLP